MLQVGNVIAVSDSVRGYVAVVYRGGVGTMARSTRRDTSSSTGSTLTPPHTAVWLSRAGGQVALVCVSGALSGVEFGRKSDHIGY